MSDPREYAVGDEPNLRKQATGRDIEGYPCPFCGGDTLLRSHGDLPQDTERVEVYCDNSFCDAREIAILILRGEGVHERADVRAVEAIDDGTEAEQESEGAELHRDEHGRVTARSYSVKDLATSMGDPRERAETVVDRRRRFTHITVEPG